MKFWLGTPFLIWGIATIGSSGLWLVISLLSILLGVFILSRKEKRNPSKLYDGWEEVSHAGTR